MSHSQYIEDQMPSRNYEISTMYECVEKLSMVKGCNIWMICLQLNLFILLSQSIVATFSICMDAAFFGMSSF